MDYSMLIGPIQILLGGLSTVLWVILTDTRKKVEKVEADLAAYKAYAAEKFLTRGELKDAVDSVNKAFEQYGNKLDARLDRLEERLNKAIEHSKVT